MRRHPPASPATVAAPPRARAARRLSVAVLAALTAPGLPAHADEFTTANVGAAGGAAVADTVDLSSVRVNPAAFALTPRYDIAGLGWFGPGRDTRWGASVVDAKTNDVLAFGFTYTGGITRPPFLDAEVPPFSITGEELVNTKRRHDFLVALAVRAFDDRFSFGISGDVLAFTDDWGGKGVSGNLALGVAGRPHPLLSLGLSARDLIPLAATPERRATLTLGLRAGLDDLDLGAVGSAEVSYRPTQDVGVPLQVRAGAQAFIKVASVRAGYVYDGFAAAVEGSDGRGVHQATWGLGLYTASGSLDYAMIIPAVPGLVGAQLQHGISLTLHTGQIANRDNEDEDFGDDDGLRWRAPAR